MTPLPEIEQLHADYCYYWAMTRNVKKTREGHPMRAPVLNAERRAILEKLVAWCTAEGYEPRRWLAAVFESRRFLFAPPWAQLRGSAAAKAYERGVLPKYEDLLRQEAQLANPPPNPNVDLIPEAEIAKASYQDPRDCLRAVATTLGWHPQSRVCQHCQGVLECKTYLRRAPIDIIGLREGRLTWAEALLGARCSSGPGTGGAEPADVRQQLPDGTFPDALRGPPPRW